MPLRIYTGARGSRFVCDDDGGFGDEVAAISRAADAPINSSAREQAAEPLLRQIGRMSQRQLFACAQHCTADCHGNCNPANPPGHSTHERRNDGIAYPGPAGTVLRVWQRGIDVQRDRVGEFMHEAHRRGYLVTQTYPASTSEAQHVNFRKAPRIDLWKVRPITPGARGPRVRSIVKALRAIQQPGARHPYLDGKGPIGAAPLYDQGRVDAVERFQRDHHLPADGVVGPETITLLRGTARRPPSRLDRAGIDLLIRHEGEILHAYNDPAGNATFGVGHLLHKGPVNDADRRVYGDEANPLDAARMRRTSRQLLDHDVARFEQAVLRLVPARWRGSHDRFNALVDLAFNLGEEILTPAAPLRDVGRALAGSDRSALIRAVLEFDKAGTPPRPEPGLTRRRHDEADLIKRNR